MPGRDEHPGRPFGVLVVCTGNICRSPAAAHLLLAGLGGRGGVEVASAGVRALVGEPVAAPMARLLRPFGVDTSAFRARQLDAQQVRGADLVLAMTRAHRSAVVALDPGALRRTVTWLSLAGAAARADADGELVGLDPAARLRVLVRDAARHRAVPSPARVEDVEDPYRRGDAAYRRALAQLVPGVAALLGTRPGGPHPA